jgi:hypothetical protein
MLRYANASNSPTGGEFEASTSANINTLSVMALVIFKRR